MNKFSDLQTFVAVVEATSFSEAARRLGTTKSIVSERMTQLEKRLGAALLRRTRPLQPTEAGHAFYEQARQLLMDLERAEQSVQDAQSSLRGSLRIAAPMAFTACHLGPLLARFAMRYPQLCVDVEADDKLANLREGRFDMAIRMSRLADSDLIARSVTVNRHLICASPAYLQARGTPRHPDELRDHDGLIYFNREPNAMWSLPVDGVAQSFRIGARLRADSAHQLLEGARAGLGLAILPSFLAVHALLAGELVPVLGEYAPSGGHIATVYRKSARTPSKIQALTEFLSEEIGHPARWDAQLAEAGLIALD
ncbi:LysR family transcriptional regulator [Lysobacter sp. K5869]|uniref:LysR family transcriptional regulator n=1 Tax=Lysobacter sp. K5869 TaxID=2820808 RepID=UPI001C0638CE|nr:LysR family transcriptional regulator [Lysobacter sp. K5869]QWP78974.1 LysR family transcriptional regulator [Lysobacter sp. K5869]